jgi:hypothetical protein
LWHGCRKCSALPARRCAPCGPGGVIFTVNNNTKTSLRPVAQRVGILGFDEYHAPITLKRAPPALGVWLPKVLTHFRLGLNARASASLRLAAFCAVWPSGLNRTVCFHTKTSPRLSLPLVRRQAAARAPPALGVGLPPLRYGTASPCGPAGWIFRF